MQAYRAVAMQVRCHAVNFAKDRAEARAMMARSLERLRQEIQAAVLWVGRDDCRLVVLPEYFLTGFPIGESIPGWADKAALEMAGPEYEALGRIAAESAVFLAGNAYEVDPKFPGLFFQTCFVVDPAGSVVLRYRRLNSNSSPTPHDVWDRYLDAYGLEAVFPVARTEIGNLGAIASEEILYPEVARCLAMRGAEVFVHPTSQANETARAVKEVCTVARAVENAAFVVSANSAGIEGSPFPVASTDGGSKVVDFHGNVLAKTGWGESSAAYAEIDLAALRRFRKRPGIENVFLRQRFEAYAESYAKHRFYPANTLLGGPPERSHFAAMQRDTWERLRKAGVIPE
jgi:predicted amidohydrolase